MKLQLKQTSAQWNGGTYKLPNLTWKRRCKQIAQKRVPQTNRLVLFFSLQNRSPRKRPWSQGQYIRSWKESEWENSSYMPNYAPKCIQQLKQTSAQWNGGTNRQPNLTWWHRRKQSVKDELPGIPWTAVYVLETIRNDKDLQANCQRRVPGNPLNWGIWCWKPSKNSKTTPPHGSHGRKLLQEVAEMLQNCCKAEAKLAQARDDPRREQEYGHSKRKQLVR
jgi:hypothetical protein